MSSSSENGPFILRFSKSMYRPDPKKGRGGKPRTAEGGVLNPYFITENIEKGFSYYKSFEYNTALPVFNTITLKPGSLSKSLRYHFFSVTGLSPSGSISPERLVFAIDSRKELHRFSSMVKFSRNKAFRASYSHLEEIDCLSPGDKLSISSPDIFETDTENFIIRIFQSDCGSQELLHFVKYHLNIVKAEVKTASGCRYIHIKTNKVKEITDRLFTHSLVRSLESEPSMLLRENYIRHQDLTLDCVLKRDLSRNYPKAAIVDSGIAESSFLREWEIGTESFVPNSEKNTNHGTFVCGRLLTKGENFGGLTYLNVEILSGRAGLTIDDFEKHMRTLLSKYSKTIKIYNISMGTDKAADDSFTLPAYVLDVLQKDFDVLFIVSAGNNELFSSSGITSPADSVHAITVGSVSHKDTNIQKFLSPSLFSRRGPGPAYFIKPDLASFGGAHEKRFGRIRPVGVFSIGANNELAEDCGTSHAVPVITSLAARLYDQYSHAFKSPFMVKALIIHHTFLHNIARKADIFTGYGVAPAEITPSDTQVTYLHEGVTLPGQIVEIPDIPVPPAMFDGDKASGEIIITLVYKAATDINYPHYYCMNNLELSVGYYKKDKWTSVVTTGDLVTYKDVGGISSKDVLERFRWQPTKVLSKTVRNKIIPKNLVMRISPSKRDFMTSEENISYYIAVTFANDSKNLYQHLEKMSSECGGILEPASELWKTC